MKFDSKAKPELIVSKDTFRPSINFLELDKGEGRLCATDGHRLVAIPVETDVNDVTGPIDAKTISEARKLAKQSKADQAEIQCNGTLKLVNNATVPRPQRGADFPHWQLVVPSSAKPIIAFNAKYLKELAEAIGQDDYMVALAFDPTDPLSTIRVYGTGPDGVLDGKNDPIAALMPARCIK